MPQALPLTTSISQSSTRQRKYRTMMAQFGDGYSQTVPDGTNSTVDSWNLLYENLNSTERTTLVNALDAVKSFDYFTWTAPGDGSQKKFKVTPDGWQETPKSGDLYDIRFSLYQIF